MVSLSLAWALIIFASCATPGQYIPTAWWLELLSVDKLVHAFLFYTQCSLLFLFAKKKHQPVSMIAVYFVGCVLYGIALEYMQAHYFSNRSSDWKDMVADGLGCVIALVFIKNLRKFQIETV